MDVEKVKELVELMKTNELSELEIVDGQTRIVLKRGDQGPVVIAAPSPAPAAAPVAETSDGQMESAAEESNLKEIVSPVVGTFYAAPSPNADLFVSVGSEIDEETVVGIIEAMKVMNEIKSEVRGKIAKILVNNGTAVEFGQPLFLVKID
jgi:acetyl-CoA carboxylase biotin carboxyl carrier protein